MKYENIPENLLMKAAEGAALFPVNSLLKQEYKKKLRAISCESIYRTEDNFVEAEFDILLNEKKQVKSIGITLQGQWSESEDFLMFFSKGEANEIGLNLEEPYFHFYTVYVFKNDQFESSISFSNVNEAGVHFHKTMQGIYKRHFEDKQVYEIQLLKENADTHETVNTVLRTKFENGQMHNILL